LNKSAAPQHSGSPLGTVAFLGIVRRADKELGNQGRPVAIQAIVRSGGWVNLTVVYSAFSAFNKYLSTARDAGREATGGDGGCRASNGQQHCVDRQPPRPASDSPPGPDDLDGENEAVDGGGSIPQHCLALVVNSIPGFA